MNNFQCTIADMRKDTVLRYFGSIAAVARFLEINQSSVSKWPDLIPELSARRLHAYTRNKKHMKKHFPASHAHKGTLDINPKLYESVA